MKRGDLEEVIRLAAVATDDVIVVVGSQAILGEIPDPPDDLTRSMEADVYPLNHADRADAIDARIGEGTHFAQRRGFWAHAVGTETVEAAPLGWQDRCVQIQVPGYRKDDPGALALCMGAADLLATKLGAGREKDVKFVEAAVRHGIVGLRELKARVDLLPETVSWDRSRNPRQIALSALSGIEQRSMP